MKQLTKPLAFLLRPTEFSDIVGQDHLVGVDGVITKLVENHHLTNLILYGNPGCGKTTIAEAICHKLNNPSYKFNASTDNKDALKKIINEAKFYNQGIIIVDEIHRMKKDIQDYLLPSIEAGEVYIIGLTTVNPYHSVNPAIRSRCNIYRINDLKETDVIKVLKKAHDTYFIEYKIREDVYSYIAQTSGNEIRSSLNMLEMIISTNDEDITIDKAIRTIGRGNIYMDKNGDYYYNTLSGLQKSIRGSDVDASLHYLAMLLAVGDLDILNRRLRVIAYEDIGLANPGIGPRVDAVINASKELGMPECRIPYSNIVIEMALSPKSNSAILAIDAALKDVEAGKGSVIPLHLSNIDTFDPNQKGYIYPHDYPNAWVNQQYMPDDLVGVKYYHPKETSKTETLFKNRYDEIEGYKKKK